MKIDIYKTTFEVNTDTYDCEEVVSCLKAKQLNAWSEAIPNVCEGRTIVIEGRTIDPIRAVTIDAITKAIEDIKPKKGQV